METPVLALYPSVRRLARSLPSSFASSMMCCTSRFVACSGSQNATSTEAYGSKPCTKAWPRATCAATTWAVCVHKERSRERFCAKRHARATLSQRKQYFADSTFLVLLSDAAMCAELVERVGGFRGGKVERGEPRRLGADERALRLDPVSGVPDPVGGRSCGVVREHDARRRAPVIVWTFSSIEGEYRPNFNPKKRPKTHFFSRIHTRR